MTDDIIIDPTAMASIVDGPPAPPPKDSPPASGRKPRSDKGKPRGPRGPRGAKQKAEVTAEQEKIQKWLAKAATEPSKGFRNIGDEACAEHFERNGPVFAAAVSARLDKHNTIRKFLMGMVEGAEAGSLVAVIIGFFYFPLAHHDLVPQLPLLGMLGFDVPELTWRAEIEALLREQMERESPNGSASPTDPNQFDAMAREIDPDLYAPPQHTPPTWKITKEDGE